MKFKLVEEILLETWYLVEFNTSTSTKRSLMFLSNDSSQAKINANKILTALDNNDKLYYSSYVSDKNASAAVNYCKGYSSIKSISQLPHHSAMSMQGPSCPIIVDESGVIRTKSKNVAKNSNLLMSHLIAAGIRNIDDVSIHHIDGNEYNPNIFNLVIIPNNNINGLGSKINQLLHKFNWDPRTNNTSFTTHFYALSKNTKGPPTLNQYTLTIR